MKEIIITEDYQDCRIDRFLKEKFFLTQGEICKYLRNGMVKLNKKKASSCTKLNINDIVCVFFKLMEARIEKKIKLSEKPTNLMAKKIESSIIFEDEDLIVIDKPYGISVQGGDGIRFPLIDILNFLIQERDKDKAKEIRIVHRLDKDTTGIMIFAKNRKIASDLSKKFREHKIRKEYIAILDGIPEKKSGRIETKIKKLYKEEVGSRSVKSVDGEIAISEYKILEIEKEKNRAKVLFIPKTGRMHQIRMHAKELNCPIVGDEKYNENCKKNEKLQLKSVKIEFNLNEKDYLFEL